MDSFLDSFLKLQAGLPAQFPLEFARVDGVSQVVARTVGDVRNQFPEKLIPLFINNIRHRRPLPVYGRGQNVRDWLYVEDHARAIDVIFHKGKVADT